MIKYIALLSFLVYCSCQSVKQSKPNPHLIVTSKTELLVPEGIAVDSRNQDLYITSIAQRKIIQVKSDGTHKDFIATAEHGFGQGLGIKVDEKNNLLWAVSNWVEGREATSMVHVFDLKTAALKNKLEFKDSSNHLFNDLIPDGNGNAYVTATFGGEIFLADMKNNKLDLLIKDSLTQYPNGIELKNNRLYIATYSHGPLLYDIETKKLQPISGYVNRQYAFNIDGLGFRGKKLFAVYNGDSVNSANTIVAYELNKDGNAFIGEEELLKGHSSYHEPTTLAIGGDMLYVLANSHLKVYNDNKESIMGVENKLTPVSILAYKLDSIK